MSCGFSVRKVDNPLPLHGHGATPTPQQCCCHKKKSCPSRTAVQRLPPSASGTDVTISSNCLQRTVSPTSTSGSPHGEKKWSQEHYHIFRGNGNFDPNRCNSGAGHPSSPLFKNVHAVVRILPTRCLISIADLDVVQGNDC